MDRPRVKRSGKLVDPLCLMGDRMTGNTPTVSEELMQQLAKRFEWHATNVYGIASANSSPLYAHLCRKLASDPAVLSLVADADLSQQVSNLLFGAVHFLLLSGASSPLAAFYPSLSSDAPRPPDHGYPYFRAFCMEY